MIRKMLCGLLSTAVLALPVHAARPVSVQIDGEHMGAAAYVEQGVTYIPMRDLMEALGDWEVWWDHASGTAAASSESTRLHADPETDTITVDGAVYSGRVAVVNGRTYLPLRTVVQALGGRVAWDPWLDGAAVTTAGAPYDASDYYWLAHIICAESGGEPLEGQIAVGNVVLNRVDSEEFPDTIPGVIFDCVDAVQFEPVENGTVFRDPTELSKEAARLVLDGEKTIGGALFFYAPALSEGVWINDNRTYEQTIGCHRFYS
ncbi:MAG: cell wall hydrolase [Oscillibacter sp.]|nr:cell wall hydrolase [Oscillibacter sp.]